MAVLYNGSTRISFGTSVVVPYPGYAVTFNNNDSAHQTITAQLEPTWKTTEYTNSFIAGAENVGVKLHLYVNAAPGYAHGALSWSPNTFVNGGMLTSPLTVNVTNATPIADVVIPTGYEDYYLHNGLTNFYNDTNYDTYKTKTNLSGNAIIFDLDNYLTSQSSTSLSSMFFNNKVLTSLDLNNFDTSKVTNMQSMFSGCTSLTSINLNNFDTSKVTKMTDMFKYCSSLTSLDLTNFDVSKNGQFNYMFNECSSLTSLDLSTWNTESGYYFNWMFYNCTSLKVLDISNFNTRNDSNGMGGFINYTVPLEYLIIGASTFNLTLPSSNCITLPSTCKILVPQALISTYQNATNWSTHASKFDAIENYTITRSNGQVTVTPK